MKTSHSDRKPSALSITKMHTVWINKFINYSNKSKSKQETKHYFLKILNVSSNNLNIWRNKTSDWNQHQAPDLIQLVSMIGSWNTKILFLRWSMSWNDYFLNLKLDSQSIIGNFITRYTDIFISFMDIWFYRSITYLIQFISKFFEA